MLNLADSVCYCPTSCLLQVHWQKGGHTIYRLCRVFAGMAEERPFLFLDLQGRWQLLQRMILNRRLGAMSTDRQLDLCNCRLQQPCHTYHHPVCPCSSTRTEVIQH